MKNNVDGYGLGRPELDGGVCFRDVVESDLRGWGEVF